MGWAVLIGSVVGVVVYFYLAFLSPWMILTIQISAFVAVAAVLLIVAWIGYTLATTPPPAPLEEMDTFEQEASDKAEEGSKEEDREQDTA
jgi:predicted DNA-binding transcriptional regulator